MKQNYWLLTLAFFIQTGYGCAQTLEKLDQRNGFKDLALGSSVLNYPHMVYLRAHQDQKGVPDGKVFGAQEGHYENIGSVSIDEVEAAVYKDRILAISVRTPKDPNLLKGLRRAYGNPTQTLGTTSFVWRTDQLSLVYRSFSKTQLEMLYSSMKIREMIRQDKDQKIQDIADDF